VGEIFVRNIEDEDFKLIEKKAAILGLTLPAYARQILKESIKNPRKDHSEYSLKLARAKVVVMAEALGRTQGASPEATEKLKKTLLKIFEQEVQ
jgi:hypothetical protein